MRDPVSNFEYPASWVNLCTHKDNRDLVEQGLAILTADGTILLRGYTTGTTAAAAANATLYTGMLNDVFGQTPCRTLVQQAGTTRTVSGPAALSTCLRMRDELHPAQAEVHLQIYSFADVPDMTICTRLSVMINNDSLIAPDARLLCRAMHT